MSHRSCAWSNLKTSLTMNDWKRGRQSGFSVCCIIWFYLRSYTTTFYQLIFNRYPGYIEKIMHLDPLSTFWRHVACPCCKAKTPESEIKYYYCDNCNWTQYKEPTCNLCGFVGRLLKNPIIHIDEEDEDEE